MQKIVCTLVLILAALQCIAQAPAPRMKSNHFFDGAFSVGDKKLAASLAWSHLHGIGQKKQKLKIGYGIRLTSFKGKDQNYITASPKVVKGVSGPAVFLKKPKQENIDTLSFQQPELTAINASIHIQYSFTNRFDLGFNIDLIGFSFGALKSATFVSSNRPAELSKTQQAGPSSFNLLLGADNDIGTLNSEFYGKYWLSKRFAVKAGISHLFTEYTSENTLLNSNDRFRNISNLFYLGVSFSPFRYIFN